MFKKILSSLPLIGILILAGFLRLYKIADYMTFLGDEGRDVLVVYNILHGKLTLLGPTSSVGGFFLGPIYYYFMAPFLWLFHYNPVGPAVMVGIIGTITVALVYKIGKDIFNRQTGILAAALYAVSPIVIAYSRSSWNPNPMPFFTIVTLWVLYNAVLKRSLKWFIFSGFLFGIMMQLHYLATFVGVIILLYVFLHYFIVPKIEKKIVAYRLLISSYVAIFVGFIIGLSPFLAFEARHGFPNTLSITKFILHSPEVSSGGNMWGIIGNVFFRVFARLATDFPPPEQVSLQAHPEIAIWFILTLILGLVSVGLFIRQCYQESQSENSTMKTKKILQYSLIALWFFVGIFLFGFYKKAIYDYYLGFLFPLPFLFIGNLITFMFSKKMVFKILAILTFIVLFGINLQAMPFRYTPNRQLAQVKGIADFVLSKTNNKPYNFALLTGGNSDHAYRYFFTIEGRPPVTILSPSIDPERKSVTDQLLVVCESSPCAPLGNSLWEVAGFGRADIVDKWPVSVVEVYKLKHYTGK